MYELYERIQHKSGNNFPLKIYHISGVQLHWHDEYEFIIAEGGNALCMINGEAITLSENSVALVQSGIMHSIQSEENTKVTAIVVSPSLWTNDVDAKFFDGQINFQNIFNNTDKIDGQVINILKQIIEIYNNPCWGYEINIKSKFTELFGILVRNNCFSRTDGQSRKKPREFQEMINYINEHYMDKISLKSLSELSFYSPTYIIYLFKKYTNLTPAEYIIQYRLGLARNKLQNTSESNLSIALSCGFCSESYFIQAFKKRYGITPHAYRKDEI